MKNNINEKIKLSTIIFISVIVALTLIVVILIYNLQVMSSNSSKIISDLKNKISTLENKSSVLQNELNNIENSKSDMETINAANNKKTLTNNDKTELFSKMVSNKNFINFLITKKDFSIKEFTNNEMLQSLTIYDKNNEYFNYDSSTISCSGNIEKIQKLATKVFDKTINMDNIKANINGSEIYAIPTTINFTISNYNLIDIIQIDNGTYDVKFNYISSDNTSNSYTMNIKEIDDNIVYNTLTK